MNFKAVGVHYERHGVPQFAFASKEIILSGGAYISPVILMRSGIGPIDQLDLIKVSLKGPQDQAEMLLMLLK